MENGIWDKVGTYVVRTFIARTQLYVQLRRTLQIQIYLVALVVTISFQIH